MTRSDAGDRPQQVPARELPAELRRFEPVFNTVVLAAIDRAERHRERLSEGVMMSHIAEHLGFVPSAWTTRNLNPQLKALIDAGLLERSRRHGLPMIGLTDGGRKRLARARRAGEPLSLPEAPQHREWRNTRSAAAERIGALSGQVRRTLNDASILLDAETGRSDEWFEVADRLHRECGQLGSVTYCLYEWAEPNDANADVDDYGDPGDDQLDRTERHRRHSLRRWRRERSGKSRLDPRNA